MPPSSNLLVVAEPGWETQAGSLARLLGAPVACEPPSAGSVLRLGADGLELRRLGKGAPGPIRADFVSGPVAHRRHFGGGRNQDLARAVGLNRNPALAVADLTAGLGRDAFVLASLGARVTLVERHPVVAALLEDGLRRARVCADDAVLAQIVARMALVRADGRQWLVTACDQLDVDVVYLDPMFPERRKSAKVKKEMAAFHDLVGTDEDGPELLEQALTHARYRVVVKRPAGAPALGGRPPATTVGGKSTRFDIYPLQRIPEAVR